MHAADIGAYAFNAELYCPRCMAGMVEVVGPDLGSLEAHLDRAALRRGVDRRNEDTFDSGDFPKVVFVSDLSGDETCGKCYDLLV